MPGFDWIPQLKSTVQISVGQLLVGDTKGALETHAKGTGHHQAGDSAKGKRVLRAANRTSLMIATGGSAGVSTGGLGAIPSGNAAVAGLDVPICLEEDE